MEFYLLPTIVENTTECAKNASILPRFATKSLDFGQIWTRIIAEIKKKNDFQEVYMGVQEMNSELFGLFACIMLCIWMAIRMDSGSYSGHSEQILLYLCYSDQFGKMIRVVPPLAIQISPNLPRMLRTPLRIRPNSMRMYPECGLIEICRGYIRDHFLGYSAGFEHFKTRQIPPRMFQNPSQIFCPFGRENRMLPNPSEFKNSGVFAADSVRCNEA